MIDLKRYWALRFRIVIPWSCISLVTNEFWILLKVFCDWWKTRCEEAVASDKWANVILLKVYFDFIALSKYLEHRQWYFRTWNHILRKHKLHSRLIFQPWWQHRLRLSMLALNKCWSFSLFHQTKFVLLSSLCDQSMTSSLKSKWEID